MSDHSAAFKNAYEVVFPVAKYGQCWPHIARKFAEGQYCPKSWTHFEEAQKCLWNIHHAHTPEMKTLIIHETGKVRKIERNTSGIRLEYGIEYLCLPQVWDKWGKTLDKFWDSYCVAPYDNWSIGDFECMLCTPSQQSTESWHKELSLSKIPGLFRGSTEQCIHVAIPQLIAMDGYLKPDSLLFHVSSPITHTYTSSLSLTPIHLCRYLPSLSK